MPRAVASVQTQRLRPRPFRAENFDPNAAMCADAEVMRYIGNGQVQTPGEAWHSMAVFLGRWQLRGYGMWAVERRESGLLIGRVGCIDPPDGPGFELGWLLAREHSGQGRARKAASVALRHAFEVMQRERVISLIRPGNHRSVAVARALGQMTEASTQLLGSEALVYAARRAA